MPEYLTEREAKKQWCPKIQVLVFQDERGALRATTSRGEIGTIEDLPKLTRCLAGPTCSAWVEGPDVEKVDGTHSEKIDALSGRTKLVGTGRCGLKK